MRQSCGVAAQVYFYSIGTAVTDSISIAKEFTLRKFRIVVKCPGIAG